MESIFTLTIVGLTLDVVGGILIFFFGVPSGLNKEGSVGWELEDSPELRKKAAKMDCVAKMGLLLIVLGFVLQLLDNLRGS